MGQCGCKCKKKGASVTLKGNTINLVGNLPEVGKQAPEAVLTAADLSDVNISKFQGKNVVLNIFPSLDTPTCAASVRHFNKVVSELPDTVVLCISKDLPFAMSRFCTVEGLNNVVSLSGFRSDFGDIYGVTLSDSAMKGLYARSVVVLDKEGKIVYTELVSEIADEPKYEPVIECIKSL